MSLKKSIAILAVVAVIVFIIRKPHVDFISIQGTTMGTTYSITFQPERARSDSIDQIKVEALVETELSKINKQMSTYLHDSNISHFNALETTECIEQPSQFIDVLQASKSLYQLSNKAFNPLLAPLIELWGFDKRDTGENIPSDDAIYEAQKYIDFSQMIIDKDRFCVRKSHPNQTVNLSAIAKGFAVDQVAEILRNEFGSQNYLVEIGGELKVRGVSAKGREWKIAVEVPNSASRAVQKIIKPDIMGVATSGDYRNYFEKNGQRYSHTIDPVSGKPITHNLASVTVLDPSAMRADGLATAFMVMGAEETIKVANKHKIPVFLIIKKDDGFQEIANDYFKPYFAQ